MRWAPFEASDVRYTLAVAAADSDRFSDLYTGLPLTPLFCPCSVLCALLIMAGPEPQHRVVGLKSGQAVRFVVKAGNFYGCSDYSLPSEIVVIPEVRVSSKRMKDCHSLHKLTP